MKRNEFCLRRVMLGTSMLAGLVMGSAPVLAQAPALAIEEIVVTAQKREQKLQDVPISLAVVSGDTLSDNSVKSFQELGQYVPNLFVTKTPGADQITMRGIGSGPGSPSLDQSVVMFVDGVYAGNSRQFTAPFLDIERMEVLRGPQGALVGKNTSAGAINIISKRPGREIEGFVNTEYDFDLDGYRIEGGVTLPASDKFSVRVAGKVSDYDGWIYNTLSKTDEPKRKENIGRVTARYVTDMVDATVKYERTDLEVEGNPFQIVSVIANRPINLVKETGSPFFGAEFDDVKTENIAANVDVSLGDFTLSSITGYSEYNSDQREDADFIERDLAYAVFQEDFKQSSQEVRLLSPTGEAIEYVLGGYWHNSKLHERRVTGIVFAPPASTFRPFDQKSTVKSVYGQATVEVSENFDVLGSLRYTHERKIGDFALFTGPLAVSQQTGALTRTIHNEFKENHTDPSLSLQYRPNEDTMLYASYAHGSKAGGFQGAISNALANSFKFNPETSESFEAGVKASFDGRATLNVAAFETTYKNLQLSTAIITTSTTSFSFYTGNAGAAKVRGLEADGQYRLSDEFKLEGNFAWTPTAKYTSYAEGPCATGQPASNPVSGSCNLTGARLGFVPKLAGTGTIRYTAPLMSGTMLDVSTSAIYRTSARMDTANDPGSVQDGFVKFDARIAVSAEDDAWEVALLGRNLTDIRNFTFSGAASLAANPALGLAADARQRAVDPPRTIAVQAQFRF